jgi:hypothetical protein
MLDTLTVYSDTWKEELPSNYASEFVIPLEEPLIYTSENTTIGVGMVATSGRFYNVVKDDYITLYGTSDHTEYRYITTVLIPAGYYATGKQLLQAINVRMSALPSHLPEVTEAPKLVVDKLGKISAQGGKATFVVKQNGSFFKLNFDIYCLFPQFVCRDLNFDFYCGSYRWREIREYGGNANLPVRGNTQKVEMWCNLSDEPLVTVTDKNISTFDEIKYVPYRKSLLGESVDRVLICFKNERGHIVGKSKNETTTVNIVIKDE